MIEEYKTTTHDKLFKLLKKLDLIDNNPNNNAQILCHGTGQRGYDHLDDILSSGLEIKRSHEGANNYRSSGLLSTNSLQNDSQNNVSKDFASYKYTSVNDGCTYTIISVIPQNLDGILLGKIIPNNKDIEKSCFLDYLNINKLPSEFILGCVKSDYNCTEDSPIFFKLNENFWALNENNVNKCKNALDLIAKERGRESFEKAVAEFINDVSMHEKVNKLRQQKGLLTYSMPEFAKNLVEQSLQLEQEQMMR